MARHKTVTINYKNLVFNTLKEKASLLLLGLSVVFITLLLVGYLILIKQKSVLNDLKSPSIQIKKTAPTYLKTYLVKEGDYLWKIAEDTYGSGFNAYDIAKANNIAIPSLIEPGRTLLLPDVKPKQPTIGEIAEVVTAKVTYTGNNYTIKSGDSLWKIALEAYGDGYAWVKIAKANNLENPDLIHVDNTLIIPRN